MKTVAIRSLKPNYLEMGASLFVTSGAWIS